MVCHSAVLKWATGQLPDLIDWVPSALCLSPSAQLRLVIGLKFTIQLGVDITTAAIMIDTNSQAPTITIDTNTPNLATAAIQINTNSRANKPNANR